MNDKMKRKYLILSVILAFTSVLNAQTASSPKIVTYFSVFNTVGTYSSQFNPSYIFSSSCYKIGFPVGINVYKSKKVGFSFELIPYISSVNSSVSGKSQSGVSELQFHPGLIFPLKNGFSIAERFAFYSSGRYGFSQAISKTFYKSETCSYYAAIPMGFRFGNENPSVLSGVNSFFWGVCLGVSF